MAHIFVLAEGRELWMTLFIHDLTRRRYPYKMNDGRMGYIQPNPREIKLFDISIPESCIPHLMSDLEPVALPTSGGRKKAWLLAKLMKKILGLETITEHQKPSFEVRHKWINIIPIGWKKDPKDPTSTIAFLPEGGELI